MNSGSEKLAVATGGASLSGLLGVAFIILRLCNVIKWSWWWVLAPFWIPTALSIIIFTIIFTIAMCKKELK